MIDHILNTDENYRIANQSKNISEELSRLQEENKQLHIKLYKSMTEKLDNTAALEALDRLCRDIKFSNDKCGIDAESGCEHYADIETIRKAIGGV